MTELTDRGKQIRRDALKLGIPNGEDNFGGCFSVVEILTALYDHSLDEADTVILSKGCCPTSHAVILREKGLPESASTVICMYAGVGFARAKKLSGDAGRVYIIVSGAETQEGAFWETLLRGREFKLDNLTVIVDHASGIPDCDIAEGAINTISSIALSKIAMYVDWASLVIDGHHIDTICNTLDWTLTLSVPSLIIANTISGRGVSFMEDRAEWHARFPTPNEIEQAYGELW